MGHILIQAYSYRSHGNSWLWLYLWHHLHWWGVPVYMAALTAIGFVKAFLSDVFHR